MAEYLFRAQINKETHKNWLLLREIIMSLPNIHNKYHKQ